MYLFYRRVPESEAARVFPFYFSSQHSTYITWPDPGTFTSRRHIEKYLGRTIFHYTHKFHRPLYDICSSYHWMEVRKCIVRRVTVNMVAVLILSQLST